MKKIIFSIVSAIIVFYAKAEDYVETYNIISDQYSPVIQDAQIVRRINGGTVITPVFDESCPEEMKAPFAFACKIVEEYMPQLSATESQCIVRTFNGIIFQGCFYG